MILLYLASVCVAIVMVFFMIVCVAVIIGVIKALIETVREEREKKK